MTDTPTTDVLIAELRGRNFDPVNGYFTREDERLMRRAADAMQPRAGASGEREAVRQIETLRRALAWHGDMQRMATTREEWQQEIDEALIWVKANPEPGRPSFSSLAALTRSETDEAPGVEIPAGMVRWDGWSPINHALGLLASTVKSGEPWSENCDVALSNARAAIDAGKKLS